MNRYKKIMEYLRKGKGHIDSILVGCDSILAEANLSVLEKGEHYGRTEKLQLVDQLASPDPELITGYYGMINDQEAAKRFGTENLDEYSFWSWRSCGVANVMTLYKTFGLYEGTIFDLIMEMEQKGGYLHQDKWGKKDIGWKHLAIKNALIEKGFRTKINPRMSLARLLMEVSKSKFVVTSIKSRGNLGSHTIIVSGFIWSGDNSEVEIHDPYNYDNQGGSKIMKLQDLSNIYLHRGIIVWRD